MLSTSVSGDYVCVVSGASRGIGLEYTRQLLDFSSSKVIALSRGEANTWPDSLLQLKSQHSGRLQWYPLDLASDKSIEQAALGIQSECSNIDLLINCAGVLGNNTPDSPGPERSVTAIESEWMQKTFQTNLFGHVQLTKRLIPLLKQNRVPNKTQPAIIVNISARVGSISDNHLGGWYSYRMSKAAMNMFTKTLSLEVKRSGVAVISLHPGTTDTDLSRPFQKNVKEGKLFTVEKSVGHMLQVIRGITFQDTGKFYAYDGTEIPY